jgi:hypothetical protein
MIIYTLQYCHIFTLHCIFSFAIQVNTYYHNSVHGRLKYVKLQGSKVTLT